MKGIVRLSVILSLCINLAKTDAGGKDEQQKQIFNNANAINPQQKPELLTYQQITHFGDKSQPEQIIYQQRFQNQPRTQHLHPTTSYQFQQEPIMKKPNSNPQHQSTPVAMVIIAQPTYIPASMLQQGNVAQQLLSYFHGNSQARYQYVPMRNNQQPQQQYVVPTPVSTHQIPQYVQYQPQQEVAQYQFSSPSPQAQSTQFYPNEALPTPQSLVSQHHVVPHHLSEQRTFEGRALPYQAPQQQTEYQQVQQTQQHQSQHNEQQQSDYQKPRQLTEISQLAQQAAQHFLMNGGLNSETRTAPAIITGLEHFSPEQQEKIKAQLSAHFGSPLQPLHLGNVPSEQKNTGLPDAKNYNDYKQRIKNEKFIPSIQVKNGEITQNTPSGGGKM